MQTQTPPSTVRSRRKLMPAPALSHSPEDVMMMSFSQESPSRAGALDSFCPSIFEMSPATQAHVKGFGLPSAGPLTAPAYTQDSVFWDDPHGSQDTMVSISATDPRTNNIDGHEPINFYLTPKTEQSTPANRAKHPGFGRSDSVTSLPELPPLNTKNLELQTSVNSMLASSDSVDPSVIFRFHSGHRSPPSQNSSGSRKPTDQRRKIDFERGGQTLKPLKPSSRVSIIPATRPVFVNDRNKLQRNVSASLNKRPAMSHADQLRDTTGGLFSDENMPPSVRRTSPCKRPRFQESEPKARDQQKFSRKDITFSIGDDGVARVETIVVADPLPPQDPVNDDVNMDHTVSSSSDDDEDGDDDQENNLVLDARNVRLQRNYYPPSAFPGALRHKSASSPIKQSSAYDTIRASNSRGGSRLAQLIPRTPMPHIYQDPIPAVMMPDNDSDVETTIDDGDGDLNPGDATYAITKLRRHGKTKKAAADAIQSSTRTSSASHSYSHSYDSFSAFELTESSAAQLPGMMDFSPTTVTDPDVATTPSTDRTGTSVNGDAMTEEIRCICNSTTGRGGVLIMCDSCHNWLHSGCLGFRPPAMPLHYTCSYCDSRPIKQINSRAGRR